MAHAPLSDYFVASQKTDISEVSCDTRVNFTFCVIQYINMVAFSICVFCAFLATAGERDFTQNEADALYIVWGVRDMKSFEELEKNPQNFWEETEKRLFQGKNKLRTHLDFCKWFTKILKERLAKKLAGVDTKPWFSGNAIEDTLQEYIDKDSPTFAYALATCYAHAYDYTIMRITSKGEESIRMDMRILHHPESFAKTLKFAFKKSFETLASAQKNGSPVLVPPCHEILRWQITPSGLFSFFDKLVTRRKGYQLCAVSSNPENWEHFYAHSGVFQLCSGMQDHDAFTHALNAHYLDLYLQDHGISAQDQFDACCNPDALTGDLITMTHQVQAWFTQFHEAPSQIGSLNDPSNLASLLFPGKTFLSDPGLRDITPYFMHLPSDHNWRTTPLQKVDIDSYAIQGALLAWRSLYCFQSFSFLTNKDISSYMDILGMDLRYLTKPDLMRSPQFIHTILGGFCASEGHSLVTKTTENFDAFVERNKASAQKVIQSIKTLTQEHAGPLVVCLPFPVHFLTLAFYASELRALRREHTVELRTTKSHFGLFDKGSKEPLRSITIL